MKVSTFGSYLTQAFGSNKPLISVATSAILALTSFFYIYTIGSYFEVEISVLHNLFNYLGPFHIYVIGKHIDLLVITLGTFAWFALSTKQRTAKFAMIAIYGVLTVIAALTKLDIILDILALLSIPLIICTLAWNRFSPKMEILNRNTDTDLSTKYIIIAGLVISVAGVTASLAPFFSASSSSAPMPTRNYSYEIFVLLSSFFSPIFMALLVFCIPVKLIFDSYVADGATKKSSNNSDNNNYSDKGKRTSSFSRSKIIFYLSLFIILSATMTLIPHQPAVNRANIPIGQDIQLYATTIKHLLPYSNNLPDLISQTFVKNPSLVFAAGGDRPISLLLLVGVVKIFPTIDPAYVIDYIPIILGPALILAVFFLTREMTSNDTISILAAFMTVVSFQVLVGMYSTLYANWFALVIGYFSFVFMFKFLKRPRKSNLITYSVLVVLMLLTHAYAWAMIALVTGLFLLVMLKFNYYPKRNIILLLLVVLSSVIVDPLRTLVIGTGSGGSGILGSIQFTSPVKTTEIHYGKLVIIPQFSPQLNLHEFASFRPNLLDSTEHFEGGLFGNFIILALALYWLFRANRREPYNIFIMIFLSIAIVPLLFSDWILQTRAYYNIPFQIPAAIALSCIIKQYQMKGIMTMLAICIWIIAISIVNLSNFYPVIPTQPG